MAPSIAIITGVAANRTLFGTELCRYILTALCGSACCYLKVFQVLGQWVYFCLRDFRLLPRCTLDLRSSGMLCCVDWLLFKDVSEQSSWNAWPMKCGTDRLSRNVTEFQSTLSNITEERKSYYFKLFTVHFLFCIYK
jgi:hypothetical protein